MDIYERKLMLVDDNQELLEMIADILRHSGYKNIVKAKCVQEALTVFQMEKPDMAVLDVMLPDGDGFQLFQKLRENSEIPILFLSARDEDRDRLFGLGLGADDYITKPFLPPELVLRVTAILKRTYRMEKEKTQEEHILRLGSHEVLFDYGIVRFQGNETSLTAKELALLLKLHENRGRIVTFDALCNAAWGDGYYGYENTLMVHIRHLREKIEEDPSHPQWLLTVRGLGYHNMVSAGAPDFKRSALESVGKEFYQENDTWQLSDTGRQELKEADFKWCMALDEHGEVVWEWKLPAGFDRSYTISEVARFSRWYLHDYPVAVWEAGKLLLVVGLDPEFFFRYSEILTLTNFTMISQYVKWALIVNTIVIIVFVFLLGYRFYQALKPLGRGLEKLSREEEVKLREKGMTGILAAQLNRTSEILQEQKKRLTKRDLARTEWIAGVSHDIRTPLALIVGYTDRLSKSPNLNQEEKALADAVCRQSLVIRQLITDLNLTSKLAYEAQPLNKKECSPALILRECAADIYNEKIEQDKGQEPEVDVELLIPADMEKVRIFADSGLLKRALRNLIGNSVRHNPGGCQVMVRLYEKNEKIYISVKDTGKGVPELVVQNMDNQTDKVHIMGLRLARQIVRAHGGELIFEKRESGTYDVTLELSVSKLHP